MIYIIILVSFLASLIGCICGIGGGIVIKPVLDSLGTLSITQINFLSGFTVLFMTLVSVAANYFKKSENMLKTATVLPLAVGASAGGVAGKHLFESLLALFENKNQLSAVQAAFLLLLTLFTIAYTLKKDTIKSRRITGWFACGAIGLLLGAISSFLGIGGGPINIIVLFYFFSMDTKTAAQNSLYIIFFSQLTSLLTNIVNASIPEVNVWIAASMALMGVAGSISGRILNKKISCVMVDKLFIGLMIVIVLINTNNLIRFLA